MKTIKIKVKERMGLIGLLNKTYEKGGLDLKSLTISQKLVNQLIIQEDEGKKIKWEQNPINGNFTWDLKKDKGKDIEFTDDALKLVADIIKRRNDSKEFALEDTFLVELTEKLGIEV